MSAFHGNVTTKSAQAGAYAFLARAISEGFFRRDLLIGRSDLVELRVAVSGFRLAGRFFGDRAYIIEIASGIEATERSHLLPVKNLLYTVKRCTDAALDVAFPASCANCGAPIEASPLPHVCADCFARIRVIEDPRCLTCGYPFFGETVSHEGCSHCDRLDAEFGRGWSVSLFSGPVRSLIYALKYENALWALDDLGRIAGYAEGLSDYLEDSILAPVPLHKRKLRERGYNQSALIADAIARDFGVSSADGLVERVVDTPSQTRLNREDRYRNLKNAFQVAPNRTVDRNVRYIVVDDVFTTGSTLSACASVLRSGGAKAVDVLTLGHG